jgi:uncharacterized membrane protein
MSDPRPQTTPTSDLFERLLFIAAFQVACVLGLIVIAVLAYRDDEPMTAMATLSVASFLFGRMTMLWEGACAENVPAAVPMGRRSHRLSR